MRRPPILHYHYFAPPAGEVSFSITWSMPKLAGFCRGGNFWKLESHCTTNAWAGTSANIRSARQCK